MIIPLCLRFIFKLQVVNGSGFTLKMKSICTLHIFPTDNYTQLFFGKDTLHANVFN